MKPVKTTIPPKSLLHTAQRGYGYSDSFRGILQDNNNQLSPADVAKPLYPRGPASVPH